MKITKQIIYFEEMIVKLRKWQSPSHTSTRIVYLIRQKERKQTQKWLLIIMPICRDLNKEGQIRLMMNSQLTKIIGLQSYCCELRIPADIRHITAHASVDMGTLTVSCWQCGSWNTDQCCYYEDKTSTPKCFPPLSDIIRIDVFCQYIIMHCHTWWDRRNRLQKNFSRICFYTSFLWNSIIKNNYCFRNFAFPMQGEWQGKVYVLIHVAIVFKSVG